MASESIYAPKVIDDTPAEETTSEEDVPPPNPYLTKPILYISDIDTSISDRELANSVFQPFVPVRLSVNRDIPDGQKARGTVEFQTIEKAERAFASVQSPGLSINEDPSTDPSPLAKPRLIKQLPHGTEDVDVYDIFRPYGPLARTHRIVTNPQGHHTGFRGMASVVYYHEEDAQRAQTDLHCAEVEGKTISVSIDTIARRPIGPGTSFSASAAPFVPGASGSLSATAPAFQPPRRSSPAMPSSPLSPVQMNDQQGGPMLPVPGTNLQYSASAATYIDPCNLFCKNLDPTIDSNYLFNIFRMFGKIISARVMRDDKGVSREFGFVSFDRPESASRALRAMNQTMQGNKQMIVRLHEPKSVRQEKLSHKFGSSFVGADEVGPSSEANGSSGGSQSPPTERSRERRSSNSYFRAAASGENGNDAVDLEQLKTMSSSLRVDIIKGEFSRRIKALEGVQPDQVDSLVSELSQMRLFEAVSTLNDPSLLAQRVQEIQARGSQDGNAPHSGPTTPSVSMASPVTERERLQNAVTALLPVDGPIEEITNLLVGLPKKERAMALFNEEYLQKKVEEAKAILEIPDDDDESAQRGAATISPLTKENIAMVSASNALPAKETSTKSYSLIELASMPAVEIIKLANSSQSSGLPLPKADPEVTKSTDDFVDSLSSLSPTDQKQKLGDQLFKKIRTFGVKGAPKITIALLDSEDLRSLAHLMNSYTDCLREKVVLKAAK